MTSAKATNFYDPRLKIILLRIEYRFFRPNFSVNWSSSASRSEQSGNFYWKSAPEAQTVLNLLVCYPVPIRNARNQFWAISKLATCGHSDRPTESSEGFTTMNAATRVLFKMVRKENCLELPNDLEERRAQGGAVCLECSTSARETLNMEMPATVVSVSNAAHFDNN